MLSVVQWRYGSAFSHRRRPDRDDPDAGLAFLRGDEIAIDSASSDAIVS
jgi:hypothetical protein